MWIYLHCLIICCATLETNILKGCCLPPNVCLFSYLFICVFILSCMTDHLSPLQQALRLRQNSDPWMPVQVIHNGGSPQQVPRTSPTIVPKGSGSSRKNKTRSHSFHLPASRPLIREVETKQQNGKFEYTDCFHSKKGQEVLCDMWESQELCDITLRVKGREFKAHKTVLASSSPYFRAMFTCGLSECKQSTIDLDAISSPTVMECILRYFYSSKFTIESDLVQDVIPAADVLQVIALKEACAEYLLRQLSVGNCLGVYAFADIHNCHKLKEEALKLIQRNFPELILTNEYKQLSYDHILNLVSLDHLAVSGEGRVFDAVMCWVKHNIKERRQHLKDLLLQVSHDCIGRVLRQREWGICSENLD